MGSTLAALLIVIVLMLVIAHLIIDRSDKKKKQLEAESKLKSLEYHLSQSNSIDAKIIYTSYFAQYLKEKIDEERKRQIIILI